MNTLYYHRLRKKAFPALLILIPLISALLITGCSQPGTCLVAVINVDPPFISEIPDFSAISDIKERKRSFFKYMGSIIKEENAKVLKKRERLLFLYSNHINKAEISIEDLNWLENLRTEFKGVKSADDPEMLWTSLLGRVDILPLELALAQAAKESGWGSSRFARRGNNLFGQWCFHKGCGLVPTEREPGAIHEVKKFDSVKDSVRSYIYNLNTNNAYNDFRKLRLLLRRMGITPDGYSLVSELLKYSEMGEDYVKEIRAMILINMPYIDA